MFLYSPFPSRRWQYDPLERICGEWSFCYRKKNEHCLYFRLLEQTSFSRLVDHTILLSGASFADHRRSTSSRHPLSNSKKLNHLPSFRADLRGERDAVPFVRRLTHTVRPHLSLLHLRYSSDLPCFWQCAQTRDTLKHLFSEIFSRSRRTTQPIRTLLALIALFAALRGRLTLRITLSATGEY